jgi:hypothetical protein
MGEIGRIVKTFSMHPSPVFQNNPSIFGFLERSAPIWSTKGLTEGVPVLKIENILSHQ